MRNEERIPNIVCVIMYAIILILMINYGCSNTNTLISKSKCNQMQKNKKFCISQDSLENLVELKNEHYVD